MWKLLRCSETWTVKKDDRHGRLLPVYASRFYILAWVVYKYYAWRIPAPVIVTLANAEKEE